MAQGVYDVEVYEPGIYVDDEVLLPASDPANPSGLTLSGAMLRGTLAGPALIPLTVVPLPGDQERGAYGTELIVSIDNYDGQRLFTEWMLSDDFTSSDNDIGRLTLLRQVDSLRVGTAPVQGDLLASLGVSEQASLRVVFDNRQGFWTRLIAQEVLLTMTTTLSILFGPEQVTPVFRGQVSRVRYRKDVVEIEFSEP